MTNPNPHPDPDPGPDPNPNPIPNPVPNPNQVDALYEGRVALHLAAKEPLRELLAGAGDTAGGAEVATDGLSISFADAPVGGRYRADGELAAFFTAADEQFMVRRTLSRLVEMCGEGGDES